MSKKDYQAIARAIHEARESWAPLGPPSSAIIGKLAEVFAADNPRFDRARFIEACETGTTKGMPRAKVPACPCGDSTGHANETPIGGHVR